jgi:hypothetical protein
VQRVTEQALEDAHGDFVPGLQPLVEGSFPWAPLFFLGGALYKVERPAGKMTPSSGGYRGDGLDVEQE